MIIVQMLGQTIPGILHDHLPVPIQQVLLRRGPGKDLLDIQGGRLEERLTAVREPGAVLDPLDQRFIQGHT